jgi:hypothetical protein
MVDKNSEDSQLLMEQYADDFDLWFFPNSGDLNALLILTGTESL